MTDLKADGLTTEDLLYIIALRLDRIAVALEGKAVPQPAAYVQTYAPQAAADRGITYHPDAPSAAVVAGLCPVHATPWEFKSGIGRDSGKPYSFWGCPAKDNGKWCQQRPPVGFAGPAGQTMRDLP